MGAAGASVVMGDGATGGSRAIMVEAAGVAGVGEVMGDVAGVVGRDREGTGGSTWSRERDSHSILEASVGGHSLPDTYQPFWKSIVACVLAAPSHAPCTATQLCSCLFLPHPEHFRGHD